MPGAGEKVQIAFNLHHHKLLPQCCIISQHQKCLNKQIKSKLVSVSRTQSLTLVPVKDLIHLGTSLDPNTKFPVCATNALGIP